MISVYIQREKRKFVQTIGFIQSHCEFIFIRSRYSIKPKKLISVAAEAVCRAGVVIVVLRDTIVEVFNAAHNVLVGDITIGYEPPRRGWVIPLATYQ